MWSKGYSTETDLAPEAVWAALRDWSTGVIPRASGDRCELRGEFAPGATIASMPQGLGIVLDTRIVTIAENEELMLETPFNGLSLQDQYSLRRLAEGGTHLTRTLVVNGDDADAVAAAGPRISADFPEAIDDLLNAARKY